MFANSSPTTKYNEENRGKREKGTLKTTCEIVHPMFPCIKKEDVTIKSLWLY